MAAPPTCEHLDPLKQADGGLGEPEGDAGRFEHGGEMRCLMPDCPHPVHQTAVTFAEPSPPPPPRISAPPAWRAPNWVWRVLWKGWTFAREVSGDDAYERYLQHLTHFHPGQTPMTPAEYFKYRQEQKWSRLSRCC